MLSAGRTDTDYDICGDRTADDRACTFCLPADNGLAPQGRDIFRTHTLCGYGPEVVPQEQAETGGRKRSSGVPDRLAVERLSIYRKGKYLMLAIFFAGLFMIGWSPLLAVIALCVGVLGMKYLGEHFDEVARQQQGSRKTDPAD